MTQEVHNIALEETQHRYSTTDFYTTAVLISQDFEIAGVTDEGHQGKVKRFHFENSSAVEKVVMNYVNGKLQGNLRDFRNAIETVKDLVYSSNGMKNSSTSLHSHSVLDYK